ncbi:MAG: hypothetical protein QOH93_2447 [Chloroflexia bacterium]|jgi:hypothetical protein|nr:hypothetical protein [Chloroflexia bacterium]
MITAAEQITPDWLTTLLRQEGVLGLGEVTEVHIAPREDVWNSRAYRLRLTYRGDASGAPSRLFLKLKGDNWGREEAAFYRYVRSNGVDLPVLVQCFSSEYDEATGDSHVLLADLSETHFTPFTIAQFRALEVVPEAVYLQQIVDTVAEFHAYWWEHPLLGTGFAAVAPDFASKEGWEARLEQKGQELAAFVEVVGGSLDQSLVRMLREVHSRLPNLWDRYIADRIPARRALTLINGDCYFIQFLCPNRPDEGRTHMIDLDSINAFLPAFDLMYMFTTFWTREQRAEGGRELAALKRYHERLQEAGVANDSFDQLLLDYRVSIALNLLHPIWDQQHGSSEAYWRPKLSCLMAAFEDWDCMELL